ncbi:MAG: ArsA family ATPase [Acidimicrobiales bacterium]
MDVTSWCRQCRVLVVAGKGGVGKTTVSAAVGVMAASAGLDVLVVQLEGRGGVAGLLGYPGDLSYQEAALWSTGEGPGRVRGSAVTPDDALVEYLQTHGLGKVLYKLLSDGALEVFAMAAPGIRDVLVLGKVKQLELARAADLIVVDAPAAGHALTFLGSASALADVARVGPIRAQATEVVELLGDPARCQVLLVTLPEETPVNEVIETAGRLQHKLGVTLAPLVVNAVFPQLEGLDADPVAEAASQGKRLVPGHARALAEAAIFRKGRQQLQDEQLCRLSERLALPQLHLPQIFSAGIGREQVVELAGALAAAVEAL